MVNAPIERGVRGIHRAASVTSSRQSTTCWPPRSPETVFEPRAGGHIYDRAADGSECRWARILAYEPPDRVVFSWDISPQWQIETDLDRTSEVEVRFVAGGPHRTRRRAGAPAPRPARARLAVGRRAALTGMRDGRYLARYAALLGQEADMPPSSPTTEVAGPPPRCSPTPPIRPGSPNGKQASPKAT